MARDPTCAESRCPSNRPGDSRLRAAIPHPLLLQQDLAERNCIYGGVMTCKSGANHIDCVKRHGSNQLNDPVGRRRISAQLECVKYCTVIFRLHEWKRLRLTMCDIVRKLVIFASPSLLYPVGQVHFELQLAQEERCSPLNISWPLVNVLLASPCLLFFPVLCLYAYRS